jgi:hypothetical protein
MTACLYTCSVPHPLAFFLAKGWDTANHEVRNHTVKELASRCRLFLLRPAALDGFSNPLAAFRG